ncbi:hypothetical protein CC78DRAFT_584264 [Lojkania enalia]|uniref:Uncharacterized protein n=1 Tax=Lojkania enalia TaxID=147567 RepID=A0A9P4K2E4_9PLEO|nr:hypothetical protein CC78DRAFT_584264 [Didymosphaeria enalia]
MAETESLDCCHATALTLRKIFPELNDSASQPEQHQLIRVESAALSNHLLSVLFASREIAVPSQTSATSWRRQAHDVGTQEHRATATKGDPFEGLTIERRQKSRVLFVLRALEEEEEEEEGGSTTSPFQTSKRSLVSLIRGHSSRPRLRARLLMGGWRGDGALAVTCVVQRVLRAMAFSSNNRPTCLHPASHHPA